MTQEYVIQRKGAVISEGENSFVPEEGLRAAEYRLIGNTPDAKASVILLCESRNPSQWAGIIGRIYALRGWKDSFNISWMIDVVCTQSYTDNKIFNVGAKIGTGQASIQAGTCWLLMAVVPMRLNLALDVNRMTEEMKIGLHGMKCFAG